MVWRAWSPYHGNRCSRQIIRPKEDATICKMWSLGEIRVGVSFSNGMATLLVADTGTGIPQSELPRLFERLHRVDGAPGRSFEGSGIGLALV